MHAKPNALGTCDFWLRVPFFCACFSVGHAVDTGWMRRAVDAGSDSPPPPVQTEGCQSLAFWGGAPRIPP
jgi:hypothetical protein